MKRSITRAPRRQNILALGTLLLAGAGLAGCASPGAGPAASADSVYYNGKIITADSRFSIASAVAIKGGNFVAVGANDDVKKLIGPGTTAIDLQGRTVIPGLMDAHTHMDGAGERTMVVQLKDAPDIPEAQRRIKAFAATQPAGGWVQGSSDWRPQSSLKEQRYVTRQELDAVVPDRPAFFDSGHFAMANSKALQLAGVTRDTPDPVGGKIYRDASGEPTGVLEEKAIALVSAKLPPLTREQATARNLAAQQVYSSYGITSLVVAGLSEEQIAVYRQVARDHRAILRTTLMWRPRITSTQVFREQLEKTTLKDNTGDDWVKIEGIKITSDGGMTLKTAFTRAPYLDNPAFRGTVAVDQQVYKESVQLAYDHGWRVGTHAVGDAAVDLVLDTYAGIKRSDPQLPRGFSVIHGSLITPDQIDRAKSMGVRVDAQNVFMWEKAATVERLMGAAIAMRAVPTRTILDKLGYGLTAAGTDSQVNVINPYINMYIMVTRKNPAGHVYGASQGISREEALRLYTNAGPYIGFDEKRKGSIESGKLADMVVLSADYLAIPDDEIKNLKALQTIVDGKVVYDAQQGTAATGAPGV